MSSNGTDQQLSEPCASGHNIAKMKDFWHQTGVQSRQGPLVKSKNRASIIYMTSEASKHMSVKDRINKWTRISTSEHAENSPKEAAEDVRPPPGAIKNRIEVWKDVTQQPQPVVVSKEADEELRPLAGAVKNRIEIWKDVTQHQDTENTPKETTDVKPPPGSVKNCIEMWAGAAQQPTPSLPKVDALAEIALVAQMEKHRLDDIPSPTSPVVANDDESTPSHVSTPCNSPSPDVADETSMLTAVCLYDYEAGDNDELSFKNGDMISEINQIDEGWWLGVTADGRRGLFPANYVSLIN